MNRRLVMKAKSTPMVIESTPIPQSPAKGLVIKVKYAGICHSDVHLFHQSLAPTFVYPRVIGHEVSGFVHSVGTETVEGAATFQEGDRVALYPWGGCRECSTCKVGSQHCMTRGLQTSLNYGIVQDGGFEEYLVVHDLRMVVHVADDLPLDVACLLPCSGLTAYNAICQLEDSITHAHKEKGQAMIVIAGAGGVGLWAIRLLKAMYTTRLTVCVVDIADDKLGEAKEAGADITFNWDGKGTVEELSDQLKTLCARPIDGAIDFVGFPTTFHRLQLSLKYNATLVLVGLHGGQVPGIELRHIALRNLRIQGVFVGSKGQTEDLFALVREKKISPPPLTYVTLEDVNDVIATLSRGQQKGRALVEFQ